MKPHLTFKSGWWMLFRSRQRYKDGKRQVRDHWSFKAICKDAKREWELFGDVK